MGVFEHVSRYPFPREDVFAWHTRPGGFVRLTPPGMATIVHGPTNGIETGSEIILRVTHPLIAGFLPTVPVKGHGRGPVGLSWHVRHGENVPGERFVDEQVSGPFKAWRHEHLFADGPGGTAIITDRITWELPVALPLGLDEAMVAMQLDGLFRFRERQLRDDLALWARLRPEPTRIVVTGASGLVGTQVCALLATGGHHVTRLVRRRPVGPDEAFWDPERGDIDAEALRGADAVIHLAGHSIGGRFTRAAKEKIMQSRVLSTALLARTLAADGMPRTLVQASGIGGYGARRPDEVLTEASGLGTGFLAEVVRAWEAAAQPAVDAGVRAVFLRTGIALSEGGGALMPQVPLFSIGLGGRLTDANAWLSWIGLDDLARAYAHAVFTPELAGPVNAVAPRPVTAGEFAETLAQVLHRPSAVPTPKFGPALVLGREGASELIDTDQRASARMLLDSGFVFGQGHLLDALRHALMR